MIRYGARITSWLLAACCSLATQPGCNSDSPPNDPLVALYCDKGYVITADGSACVAQDNLLVHGVVTDAVLASPIPGVAVTILPFGAEGDTVTTDANGYFSRQGVATEDNILVRYEHPDYEFTVADFDEDRLGIGMTVIDASRALVRRLPSFRVAGTVYATDAPANGALVTLGRSATSPPIYDAMTDADGHFAFDSVLDGAYWIRVMPYDEDGDLVMDYRFSAINLGTLSANAGNISNLVLAMRSVSADLLYTNLIGGTLVLPATLSPGLAYSGMFLTDPTANIIFHFGAPVATETVDVILRPFEPNLGGAYGEEMPLTMTWTVSNTVLTIDPQQDLVADANTDTRYELTIRALHWADGSVAIPQNDPTLVRGFRFDIDDGAVLLVSPTPGFYTDNLFSGGQNVDHVTCDSEACWILDADNHWFGGFPAPFPGGLPTAFGGVSGFQLVWPAVPGADRFNVYARQRSTYGGADNFGNWYRVTGGSATAVIDPVVGNQVYAAGVMAAAGGATPVEWDDFDVTGAGPLAFGTEIDVVVTAVDVNGFESPIDPTKALTLADQMQASLVGVNPDFNGSGVHAATTEWGTTLLKVFNFDFSEHMDVNVQPVLAKHSGMITAMAASPFFSWNPLQPLTPENVSRDGVLGPMQLTIRGACTEVTCTATYNFEQPSLSDDRICVNDPTALAGATEVFFVTTGGAPVHDSIGVANLDTTNGLVRFTAAVDNTITTNAIACAASARPGHVAHLTAVSVAGDPELRVNDASIFYAGESVLVFDRQNDVLSTGTVARVDTTTNTLTLTFAVAAGLPSGDTLVMYRPTAAEYAYRAAEEAALRFDATAAASTTLDFTASLAGVPVMVGDLALVDLDGDFDTVADRYFGAVTAVRMVPDPMANGIDETDYHVVLASPPAGMPGLPNGTLVSHDHARVVFLGDGFTIENGAASHATPMADTSGNVGLAGTRDQFSPCVAGTLGCVGGVVFY